MNRDLLIWMAGFFDGEGCVSIGEGKRKYGPNEKKRKTSTSYALQVIVGQKDRAPLQHFVDAFGGALYAHRVRGMEYHRWLVSSDKAAAALIAMLPYLQIKREVAEVGIRFQEQMSAWNKQYGRTGYPEHVQLGRRVFYEQAKKLNARNRPDMDAPAYEGQRAMAASRAVNEE